MNIKQIVREKCGALLRFKNYNRKDILKVIEDCLIDYKVLSDDEDELVILVNANSEYEINNSLCLIKDKGYCEKYNKLLKIV